MKILIICGGPSPERNISLNSARSVYDAVSPNRNYKRINDFNLKIIFINKNHDRYLINEEFLYSNTTSDFDFKLKNENKPLSDEEYILALKDNDLVFPVMHGVYAEDGYIQRLFENYNIPYIGSPPDSCFNLYNKFTADRILRNNNFFTVKKIFLDSSMKNSEIKYMLFDFFNKNEFEDVVIKPAQGGSSFGVRHVRSFEEAIEVVSNMKNMYKIVVEERCKGQEFTVIVLQNFSSGEPVALIPTEIEVKDSENIIFDTRRKYLATNETHYHFPPRFSYDTIYEIRKNACKIFKIFDAKDFLRIDGWVLENGKIYFSDFNPISGMEQNSFIFQQASKIGLTHKEMIKYIIKTSSYRNDIEVIEEQNSSNIKKKKVNVIFGGDTSERQVSLLSGSNVWLKLLKSDNFSPEPFLLYSKYSEYRILKLSYDMVLYHTIEEILFQFENSSIDEKIFNLINEIRKSLGLSVIKNIPKLISYTLEEFLELSKKENAYIFSCLHGGFGENGQIQKKLEENRLSFNGSGSIASKICMDKLKTGEIVNELNFSNIRSAKKIAFNIKKLIPFWNDVIKELGDEIIIKPNGDGCSTGVVVLRSEEDFKIYINLIKSKNEFVPKNTFKNQEKIIALSLTCEDYLLEEFIRTDKIEIKNGILIVPKNIKFVELTVGVLESNGFYHSLNPSVSIAETGAVLSVEEKFQGGTGVNITPPPESIINKDLIQIIKFGVEKLCSKIGIRDYCRIDLFANNQTNEVIIIEVNTLPALTPSTVLFQQASKEFISISPLELIENIINL